MGRQFLPQEGSYTRWGLGSTRTRGLVPFWGVGAVEGSGNPPANCLNFKGVSGVTRVLSWAGLLSSNAPTSGTLRGPRAWQRRPHRARGSHSEGLSLAVPGAPRSGVTSPSSPAHSPRSHRGTQKCFPSPARTRQGGSGALKGLNISSWSGRVRIKCSDKVFPSFTPRGTYPELGMATDTEGEKRGKELVI